MAEIPPGFSTKITFPETIMDPMKSRLGPLKRIDLKSDPVEFECQYDPEFVENLKRIMEEQEISIWLPFFLFPGQKQSYVLGKRFIGRMWLSDVKLSGVQEGQPEAEITIVSTEENSTDKIHPGPDNVSGG